MQLGLCDEVAPASKPRRVLFTEDIWRRLAQSLRLSGREIQIVRHVFDDHKERVIAVALGISPHTVNSHFQRLYHKLDVGSRPQLIVRVFLEYLSLSEGIDTASPSKTRLHPVRPVPT